MFCLDLRQPLPTIITVIISPRRETLNKGVGVEGVSQEELTEKERRFEKDTHWVYGGHRFDRVKESKNGTLSTPRQRCESPEFLG